MARPGVMLYFDIRQPLSVLPYEEKGRLLDAILEYGEHGTLPSFDGMLALAWGFIQPKLDRDEETYENTKVQRRYAAFCKRRAGLNLPKIPFEEWSKMDNDERKRTSTESNEPLRAVDSVNEPLRDERAVDFVAFRYPTTTAAATVTPKTTTSVTAAAAVTANEQAEFLAATTADTERYVKAIGGNLGKGVVFLSDEQISDLLDKMGIETFDYYVDKLSCFIIKNDAKVKNHYETILKWWKEDAALQGNS